MLSSVMFLGGLFVLLALGLVIAEYFLVSYGACRIEVNSGEQELEVEGGRTLLSSLNDREIFIPSACGGKGTCGYCKLKVLAGGGPLLPTEKPYLTRSEIRNGVRLACQVKVRNDMTIEVPEELLSVKLFSAVLDEIVRLTYDTIQLRFSILGGQQISHHPGQYIQVRAPSPEGDVFRAYSVSSPDFEHEHVELVVRLIPGGICSTYLHSLQVGDTIEFTGPFGDFRVNEDPEIEIVCVAGGCGMAPVKSIAASVSKRWPGRPCRVFFGCRRVEDVFYREFFNELCQRSPGLSFVCSLSDEPEHSSCWDGETGMIHLVADKYLKTAARMQAFLCGPPPMIEAVLDVLQAKGIDDRDIYYDKF